MKQTRLLLVFFGLLLSAGLWAQAQEAGYWRASSSTAQSITGDIIIGNEKLTINFAGFVISRIRDLNAAEVSSVFDADSSSGVKGGLYRMNIPGARKFLHKNSLCGTDNVQWMATYVEGRSLHVAFFSSPSTPVFTRDAISNSTDLCGTFTYAR